MARDSLAVDESAVVEFAQLLARAVRQFHTYPAASPMCADAVTACFNALMTMEGRDRLRFRVTPDGLMSGETAIAPAIVTQELARRLHASHVAALDIDLAAMPRHLSRFCAHLAGSDRFAHTKTTLAEVLAEDGVETIVPVMAQRPEVLEV